MKIVSYYNYVRAYLMRQVILSQLCRDDLSLVVKQVREGSFRKEIESYLPLEIWETGTLIKKKGRSYSNESKSI